MDKDKIAGSIKEVKGAVKETVGKAVGDAKMQAEGKTEKAVGKIRTLSAASRTRRRSRKKSPFPRRHPWHHMAGPPFRSAPVAVCRCRVRGLARPLALQ